MNLESEKIELAKRILETEDANLLLQIRYLFEDQDELFINLPPHVIEGIKRGKKDIEGGRVHTFEEVKEHISKLLK